MAVIRRVPQAELEKFAREEYARRYARAPKPKLVNVEAFIGFGVPRIVVWEGVRFRAPPLSFDLGRRLLVCYYALRELREARAPLAERQTAATEALRVLRRALFPRWRRRKLRPSVDEVEMLCDWLLHVPDDTRLPPPLEQTRMDFIDTLAAFARDYPGWCGRDGFPLSWAHYQYGLRHLIRARHREDLRAAIVARVAGADKKVYTDWTRDWRAMAEV